MVDDVVFPLIPRSPVWTTAWNDVRLFAMWLVLHSSACTSYPIPFVWLHIRSHARLVLICDCWWQSLTSHRSFTCMHTLAPMPQRIGEALGILLWNNGMLRTACPDDVQLLQRMQQLNSMKGCTKPHQPTKNFRYKPTQKGARRRSLPLPYARMQADAALHTKAQPARATGSR